MKEDEWIFEKIESWWKGPWRRARVWTVVKLAAAILFASGVVRESGFERVFDGFMAAAFFSMFLESLSNWRRSSAEDVAP